MKKICLLVVLIYSIAFNSSAQTVEEILTNIEKAYGGKTALMAINTLQYSTTVKMNVMGQVFDIGLTHLKQNGTLYRKEVGGLMGFKGSYSILTDTALYTSTPAIPSMGEFPGMEASVAKADAKVCAQNQYQLETQGYFAPLINCIEKGNKVEFKGKTKTNKIDCLKILVTLKTGQQMTYYIDALNYLIIQSELEGEVAINHLGMGTMMNSFMGNMGKLKLVILYSEYKKFGDVLFPMKEKVQVGANDIELENSDFRINETIDSKAYKL